MRKIQHYINVIFNVSSHEWPRIILSWSLKFLVHVAFVMGSTVLLALFVEKYHIENLPFLYIISALFIVFGSIVFSFFLERFEKKKEIFLLTFFTALVFLAVPYIFSLHLIFFFTLFFIGLSVFIAQLNIIIALFIEELFSPLESERTFPIIESSEPLGGVFAGAVLAIGVTTFHFSALQFLQGIAYLLLFIFPILFAFTKVANKVPKLESYEEKEGHMNNRIEKTKKGLRHIKGLPFLKGMVLVVFLHFAFVNLVEFQYTSVLDANISHDAMSTQEASHSHADALTHGLAFWHVMFSLLAFFSQVLSASRIHTRLGVIRTMLVHPFINILSAFALIFKFGYATGITARGVFELTTMLHRTSYHASFYALKKSIREHVKEFMEGIIRPLGTIVGTILLSLILIFLPQELQHTAISICMVVIMLLMLLVLLKMKQQYTLIAKKNLISGTNNTSKIEAIEILSQRGHSNVVEILGKNLHDKHHVHVQCKILETLGKIQDVSSIPDILRMFQSKNKEVQLAAAESLAQFHNLGTHFFTQSFAKHRVSEGLQELFLRTRSKKVKSALVEVFKNINNADIIPFLLKVLESKDEDLIADAIYVCGLFNDVNSSYYLEKFLNSSHPRIKSSAIIALWNFPTYRLKTLIQLTSMLENKDSDMRTSGIYALGEIRAVQEIPKLRKFLESENEKISCHAAVALAKMGEDSVVHEVLRFLLHEKKDISESARKLIEKLPSATKKLIKNILIHEVSFRIHEILKSARTTILENLSKECLSKLRKYYEMIDERKEVLRIEEELQKREV